MFLRLVRARLQMALNMARSAPRWQQGVLLGLSVSSLALFGAIALACGALALLAQNGLPVRDGLTPVTVALLGRVYEYLFFFLLAGSIPFVAATLFQADDLVLLLSTPLSPRTIVAGKLLDAAAVNAAQFVFLGVPVVVGLGWATGQGASGWLWLLVTTLLLLALPPAATALLLLAAARLLGLRRVRAVVMVISVALGLAVTMLAVLGTSQAVRSGSLDLSRLQAALHGQAAQALPQVTADTAPRWLPSAWAAATLEDTAAGHGIGARGGVALAKLIGVTALLIALCIGVGQSVLTSESVLEQGAVTVRRRGGVSHRLAGLSSAVSGLLAKDQKYLARDLILLGQIGTALILFLVPFLLRAAQGTGGGMDNDLYGDLALGMVGLVVYMVTSIVGLSSVGLEGRGFWLVLASPVSRARFLRAKWLGSFGLSAGIVAALTLTAWRSFALNGMLAAGALVVFVLACLALSGLGVGLAGIFPRFIYENPAHRASVSALVLGFVLATAYLLLCAVIAGIAYLAVTQNGLKAEPVFIAAAASFVLVSVLTGLIPVQIAEQRLLNYEWEN